MEENVSSENCCSRDVYFTKDVEKTNSSGHVDEKEIVRLVRRDERHVRSGGSNIVQV